jgi:hypothetical protein
MQLPDYHAPSAKWDRYRRFFNERRPWFIKFESGEAIITKASFDPVERRKLQDTDLRIVLTTDDDCPKLKTTDAATLATLRECGHDMADKPLPKVWLQCHGSQTLLVDETTGRTVALDTSGEYKHEAWKHAPAWLMPAVGHASNAVAYLPGNGRDAIAYKVRLKVPVKPSKEARQALAELQAGCHAWCTLANWDDKQYAPKWWATKNLGWGNYIYQRAFARTDVNVVPDINDLKGEERFQIAKFGYETVYKYLKLESLQTCNEGKQS